MTIIKRFKVSQSYYYLVHRRLRRRLSKIAFDNYYHCNRCGCHTDLEIHIPSLNPAWSLDDIFFEIVCHKCHHFVIH